MFDSANKISIASKNLRKDQSNWENTVETDRCAQNGKLNFEVDPTLKRQPLLESTFAQVRASRISDMSGLGLSEKNHESVLISAWYSSKQNFSSLSIFSIISIRTSSWTLSHSIPILFQLRVTCKHIIDIPSTENTSKNADSFQWL